MVAGCLVFFISVNMKASSSTRKLKEQLICKKVVERATSFMSGSLCFHYECGWCQVDWNLGQLWAGMGVFLIASSLRLYAICHQLQAQAQAAAAAASTGGLVGHPELRLRMNPLLSFATRAQLQGLRLQLALLDREFDDLGAFLIFYLVAASPWVLFSEDKICWSSLHSHSWYLGLIIGGTDADYDALRALDADNPPGVSAMSDIEINRLPVRNYKAAPVLPTPHSQLRQVQWLCFVFCLKFSNSRHTGL
jgi:E3 ubiquitin-protein ligase SDIR1